VREAAHREGRRIDRNAPPMMTKAAAKRMPA
jgi:hypothetical protein